MKNRGSFASTLLTGLTIALMCVGCADGGANDSGDREPQLDPTAAAVSWAKCMRDHGVDIPDPKDSGDGDVVLGPGAGGGVGEDSKEFREAQEACKKYAKDMGGAFEDGFSEEDQARMLEFAKCMRDNGVDMPDPDFDAGDGQAGITFPDPNDPTFDKARKACRDLAPEGL